MESKELWQLIFTGITAVVSGVLGAGGFVALFTAYWNHKRQATLDAGAAMQGLFEQLQDRVKIVEAQERECLEAKHALTLEVGHLRSDVETLRAKLVEYLPPLEPVTIVATSEGIIASISGGLHGMFGWNQDELIGKPVSVLIPPYLRGAHQAKFAEAKEGNAAVRNLRLRDTYAQTRFGARPVSIILNSFDDESGARMWEAEIHAVKQD